MYLITAALIYANGRIHLGHVRSTYLPADIHARYLRLMGKEVYYISATDEHGTPIVLEAEKQGKSPKELVNYYYHIDRDDFTRLGMSFDIFHRTSSKENYELTQHFFLRMKENGFVYKKEVKQYYCQELGKFMPDRYIKGICPYCGAPDQYADQCEKCGRTLEPGDLIEPRCTLTGTKPVLKEAVHWFFRLSAFREALEDYLTRNKNLQPEVISYVQNWLSDLKDWDITRNLDWGIPVPGEENLVFYVWFDAPIGYISSTAAFSKKWKEWWSGKARVIHYIGKDIIYHHYLFWPAMLLAVEENYTLPWAIPTRGHLTLEGKKFSKSRGWYLTLSEFLEIFPADYLRYYMTAITPYSLADSDFSLTEFKEKVNNELIANFGNFVYRVSRLAEFPISVGVIPSEVLKLVERYHKYMLAGKFKLGLETAMAVSSWYNAFLNKEEPWKRPAEKQKIMEKAAAGVVLTTTMLSPFIPFATEKISEEMGFSLTFSPFGSLKRGLQRPVFAKVQDSDINKLKSILVDRTQR